MQKKKRKPNVKRAMIQRLVKVPSNNHPSSKSFWPREMKIASYLFSKYPNEDFWLDVSFSFKLNSLAWLKSEKGSKEIQNKYNEYNYEVPELEKPEELSDTKFGEDVEIKSKNFYMDDL
jgi:hypothetical protein